MTESFVSDETNPQRAKSERDWFLIALLVAQPALMASTWRLWFGPTTFPAVPLLRSLESVPLMADRLLASVLVAAILIWLGTLLFSFGELRCARRSPLAVWSALISSVALAALNQHRLQPWHWLFILVAAQTLLISPRYQVSLRRLTLATIYIFAGLSRLGSDVDTGMVRQLVSVICEKAHLAHLLRNPQAILWMCALMTMTEFLTGVGLMCSLTRKYATFAAVTMHVLLLVLLGPWGLNHHDGVLIWNAFFAVGIPLLFTESASKNKGIEAAFVRRNGRFAAIVFAAFVILFPLSGLFGFADNWPSWQVYSPRPEVIRLYVKASAVRSLPQDVQSFVGAPTPLEEWCPVRIDQWSLATVNAPLYPEDRFQLAIANYLGQKVEADSVKATIDSAPLQFWKNHRLQVLYGTEAIRKKSDELSFNALVVRH